MSWIMALVGFAGVMAVLSTLVSVAVETIHKALAMRRSGLQEMMRAMHDNVVQDWSPGKPVGIGEGRSAEAVTFAKEMTRNPAFGGGGRWWWPRNWPLLKLVFFQPNLERLSSLQFFEQLGQSSAGQAIVARPAAEVRQFVLRAAQELDRYGEMQSEYFSRRAKAISGLAAFVLVAVGNINALSLYQWLAVQEDPVAIASRVMSQSQQLESAAASGQASVGGAVAQFQGGLGAVSLSNLPIGSQFFPYCAGAVKTAGCENAVEARYHLWPAFAPGAEIAPVVELGWVSRLVSFEGLFWILTMIVTAGLIGLGAPFWFQLFRNLGAVAGAAKIATAAVAVQSRANASASPIARPEKPNLDDLTNALLRTSGKADAAGLTAAASSSAPAHDDASSGMRRIRT